MVEVEVDDKTVFAGNLDRNVDNFLLYELFLQAGPIDRLTIENAVDGSKIGVIGYKYRASVPYAQDIFRGTRLYNRELDVSSENLLDNARMRANEARNRMLQNGNGLEREPRLHQQQRPMGGRPHRREFDREREFRPYDRHDRRHGGGDQRHGNNDRNRPRHYDRNRRHY